MKKEEVIIDMKKSQYRNLNLERFPMVEGIGQFKPLLDILL